MQQASLREILEHGFYAGGADPAIEFEGRWYDCDWFREAADSVARQVPGDVTVSIIPRNRPEMAAALVSLLIKGQPIQMIYAFQSSEGKARDIRSLRPGVIIAEERDWDALTLDAACAVGAQAIALRGGTAAAMEIADVKVKCDPALHVRDRSAVLAPGVQILTSGTTGAPKRILLSNAILASIAGERFVNAGGAAERKPVSLVFPPFGNVAGLYALLPAAARRAPFALLEKFTVDGWCSAVERNQITVAGIPPAGIRMILEQGIAPKRLSSLTHVYSGAAPLEMDVQDAFEQKYGVPVVLSYGATEFGGPIASMSLAMRQQWPAKRHSVGQAFAGCHFRIVAADGQQLSPGHEGIIEVMSPRIGADWHRTSDLGVVDEDGFLYVRGRADRTINRGGFKVSPDLIVDALRKHPSVAAAAATGMPDARLGSVPVAVVELKPAAPAPTERELIEHARTHLYSMLVPVRIRIVPELPRNQSFKVDLAAIERMFSANEVAHAT